MTRMYIQPSWIDAANDHDQWSGGNGQYRGDRSADLATFDKNGRARVEAFSDDAINARKETRKSSIPLKYRILPQTARVERLTQQMKDLVEEYKQGIHTAEEYTLLLDVLSLKRSRAIELLNKAKNTKPKRFDDEDTHVEPEQENVVLKGEIPTKQSQKKLESCVFLGACVLICILMLIMSH